MEWVAEIFVALVELLETEAKAFRRGIRRLAVALMLMAGAAVFMVAGIGLMLWGVYIPLTAGVGLIGAAFITGGVSLLVMTILYLCARAMTR